MLRSRTGASSSGGVGGTSVGMGDAGMDGHGLATSQRRMAAARNRRRRRQQFQSSSSVAGNGRMVGNVVTCLCSFALACVITSLAYSKVLGRMTNRHLHSHLHSGGGGAADGGAGRSGLDDIDIGIDIASDGSHTVKTKHLRNHHKGDLDRDNLKDKHPRKQHDKNHKIHNQGHGHGHDKISMEEEKEIVEQQADDIVPIDTIYSMTYPSINHVKTNVHERDVSVHTNPLYQLSNFMGRVAIVINVASEWGKTDLTYRHMKDMLERYTNYGRKIVKKKNKNGQIGKKKKEDNGDGNGDGDGDDEDIEDELEAEKEIAILAFPTNDFHQETGTNDEIQSFVQEHLGEQYDNPNFVLFHKSTLAHNPIYKKLREHMPEPEHEVRHNFYKYLIGRDGVPVGFYKKKTTLFDMESAIVEELETF